MSFAAFQAIKESRLPPTERYVAFMLADHLNDSTGRCDPSVALIVEETGLSKRTVVSAILALEKKGFLIVTRHQGGRSSYQIVHNTSAVNAPMRCNSRTGATLAPVQEMHQGGATSVKSGAGAAPEQEEQEETKSRTAPKISTEDLFGNEEPSSMPILPSGTPEEIRELWETWKIDRVARSKLKGSAKLGWNERAEKMGITSVIKALELYPAKMVADKMRCAIESQWKGLNLHGLAESQFQSRPVKPNGQKHDLIF